MKGVMAGDTVKVLGVIAALLFAGSTIAWAFRAFKQGRDTAGSPSALDTSRVVPALDAARRTLCLASGAMIWIGLGVYSWSERRKAKQHKRAFTEIEVPTEYTARYNIQDRVIAVVMAAFFLALVVVFSDGANHIAGLVISTCFCCFSVLCAVHLIVSRIQFTRDQITSRTCWREEVSESYSCLRRVASEPGAVNLHFSDSRSIKLHPGLGNPDMVLAYLSKYAPKRVIHRSVHE
jgi:hypothetical protein